MEVRAKVTHSLPALLARERRRLYWRGRNVADNAVADRVRAATENQRQLQGRSARRIVTARWGPAFSGGGSYGGDQRSAVHDD
jgi:hypothetical protein